MKGLIRTRQHGCWQSTADPWGTAFEPVNDPLAEADGPPAYVFLGPKIPTSHWTRIIKLFCYLTDSGNPVTGGTSEVQVVLARKENEFRCFVPKQEVERATVEADYSSMIDLETGEVFEGLPDGWDYAGTVHSHNKMGAFWSGTDNEDQVKCWGLHLVCGKLDLATYAIAARITRKNQIIDLEWDQVIEGTGWDKSINYNEAVHGHITLKKAKATPLTFFWESSAICVYGVCRDKQTAKSVYCTYHEKPDNRMERVTNASSEVCEEKTCIENPEKGSRYCSFHGYLQTYPKFTVPRTLDQVEQDLLVEISVAIDEHLTAWNLKKLEKDTAISLLAIIASRSQEGVL